MIKKITSLLVIPILLSLSSGFTLAAETEPVLTVYNCQYNPGQNAKDLDGAVEFWQAQVKKLAYKDLDTYFAAVATPLLASTDTDFFWFGVDPNLNTMARGAVAYSGSKEGMAADARFGKVGKCKVNTFFIENLYQGMAPEEGDTDTVLEMFACTLKDGKTMDNARAAEAYWKGKTTAAGAKMNVYRWTPFYANTPFDLVYLGVHDDLEAFAATTTNWITSEASQSTGMAWSSVMNCESGLFAGHMVHMPKAPQ